MDLQERAEGLQIDIGPYLRVGGQRHAGSGLHGLRNAVVVGRYLALLAHAVQQLQQIFPVSIRNVQRPQLNHRLLMAHEGSGLHPGRVRLALIQPAAVHFAVQRGEHPHFSVILHLNQHLISGEQIVCLVHHHLAHAVQSGQADGPGEVLLRFNSHQVGRSEMLIADIVHLGASHLLDFLNHCFQHCFYLLKI